MRIFKRIGAPQPHDARLMVVAQGDKPMGIFEEGWLVVQEGRRRYRVSSDDGTWIRKVCRSTLQPRSASNGQNLTNLGAGWAQCSRSVLRLSGKRSRTV